jgi:tetratricopeptide (TPR) repeat protein
MQNDFDRELQNYFTDVEHLREWFNNAIAAPTLKKRLLIIHGVGGVGKSSLLRMFRLHCKSVGVPVALASGDEQKSTLDVLARWADDLKADGVVLPEFGKTFQQYRAIQAKVENEATKVAGKLAKGAAATVVETVASTIPGIGPLVGKLGGMGAEALVDWLRGFLKQPDIDLLLDPAKKLTADFLTDLEKVASKRRLVLMLDTFEQMTVLEDWAREIAQRLPANVLLVIAGRALPNWDRGWSGWMAHAQVEELKPMSEDDMRELIRRYYATLRGGEPDPKQVEAIIRFARGLPMVITSAVQLWVKYGVEEFQAVKPEIVANLVDRLMEGVPKAMVPALEAAAVVRWFDQPILRAVMEQKDVREVYNELRRFPFVRTRAEGLAMHDAVREMVDENLRVQDAERHRELHERAAVYFEKRLEKARGEEAERFGLERLYHCVRADEETGIQLFQEMAEELARYRLVTRLRVLLDDVNTYPLERENSRLWRRYYDTRLVHFSGNVIDAEKIYQIISVNEYAEPKLRAYALSDLGVILRKAKTVAQTSGLNRVVEAVESSNSLLLESDQRRAINMITLGGAYRRIGDMERALEYLCKALTNYEKLKDLYGTVNVISEIKDLYAIQGNWRKMLDAQLHGLTLLPNGFKNSIVSSNLLGSWAVGWIYAGRYAEAEKNLRASLSIQTRIGEGLLAGILRDLGLSLGFQHRYREATECFTAAIDNYFNVYETYDDAASRYWAAVLLKQGDLRTAEEHLNRSWEVVSKSKAALGPPENLTLYGQLHVLLNNWIDAEHWYSRSLEYRWTKRHYFICAALTGLVRVKHAQGNYSAILPLLAEAEGLAQQYEYNDHLASLRLTQGHIAWEGNAPAWENGFDAALRYYQHALIYALRYNRFLLDEVLSGRPQGTPLRPIIPECLKRGEEGRRMLITLRDWWQTGINDVGTPRPDTISPIPEGIALLEAERIARDREPGEGSPQKSVVEQIEVALKDVGAGYR